MTDPELAEIRSVVRTVVHAELQEARSLRKNGDSIPGWVFSKFLTPDRFLMLIVLGFTVGGKTATITTDTAAAMKTAAAATTVTGVLSQEVSGLTRQVAQLAMRYANVEETKATRADVAALNERLKVTVTRGELRDTVQREILPRLVRIEQKVGQP